MSSPWMEPHYDATTLLAAWVVAIYAVYLLSLIVHRVRAHDRDSGFAWVIGGALCVGTGIWSSGLLGLISWELPVAVGYMPAVVLASWLPAVGLSGGVIWVSCQSRLGWPARMLGGLMATSAICLLAYINVSSVVFQPQVDWDGRLVLAASVVSLCACALSSVLLRRARQGPKSALSAIVVATLVASVFGAGQMFIIMAAKVPDAVVCLSADQLSGESLQFVLTAPVLLLLALVHIGAVLDARAQQRQDALKASLQRAQAALEEAAQQDAATGLFNRLGFEKALRKPLESQDHAVQALCVIRLSLEGLKAHVETFGENMGDTIVAHMAARLRRLVREGDVLGRSDTDEFLLLCHGLSDEHTMAQLAQRLGDAIREPCLIQDQDITLSCSIGVACFPASTNADQLLAHSRDAMLTARKAGGGVYCFYERGMDRVGADQIEMQRDLRHAIDRNELSLHFQPKLRASDHALSGVEALLRWTHPVRGAVSPAQFIPVAERFGLIGELGLWVLDEACRHIRAWHDAGHNIPVAINLSAHQLRQPDLERRVREALRHHRVPARMLIMEITESAAMEDIEASLRVFDMLDAIGVRLAIDDFGTGYSSLSYLRRLPARQLKIDRSFVKDLASSLDAQAIVEAVVRLSHALGLKVVAEGVETHEQAYILARLQCDEFQGFLFAKPMCESALLTWMAQRGAPEPTVNQPAQAEAGLEDEDWRCWSDMETAGT